MPKPSDPKFPDSMTPRPLTLWSIRIFSLIGLALSAYLAWNSWNASSHLIGCGEEGGAGCDEVTQTKWSSWFGIPVSAAGLLVYAGIFGVSLHLGKKATRLHWLALVFLTVLASGSALWFITLQMFVVKSYCIYCMTVHACSIALTVLVLRQAPVGQPDAGKGTKRRAEPVLAARQAAQAALAGFVGVAILVGGQLLPGMGAAAQDQLPETQATTEKVVEEKAAPSAQTQIAQLVEQKIMLLNGKFSIQPGDFPMIGSPEAQRVVAHFFDYTCPSCRELHPSLLAAYQKVESQVALVMIPMPLDAACNPGVRETSYQHQNACLFAQMGIALWTLHPDAFRQYDEFMFQSEYPPSAEQAVSFAYQLVGRETMNAAMEAPRSAELLRQGIDMFYSPAMEKKVLPILVTREQAIYGIPKVEDLSGFLATQFQ